MATTNITRVFAWEALDSRGTPTVACEVTLAGGARASAIVPSGASTGAHEAVELRDGGERFGGRGVRQAVANVTSTLADAVTGLDARDQAAVDAGLREADGTPNLSRLGGNAVLAVSLATALAAAAAAGQPLHVALSDGKPLLPLPMINVISGGAHATSAVDFQDFLVVPIGARSFAEAIEWAWRVRQATQQVAAERGLPAGLVADEGGLGPPLPSNRSALELLAAGIERSGLVPGTEVAIAIDVAATQLSAGPGVYSLASEGRTLDAGELVAEVEQWLGEHPIVSVEDILAEDDWDGWLHATETLGGRVQLLGDDLLVTSVERLDGAIERRVANSILVKPNQVGTLSDAHRVVLRAQAARYGTVLSARSGDTEDSWLADLAVAWRTEQIKVGSLARSERNAKWNRLLEIEASPEFHVGYAGPSGLGRYLRPEDEAS